MYHRLEEEVVQRTSRFALKAQISKGCITWDRLNTIQSARRSGRQRRGRDRCWVLWLAIAS